MESIPCRRSDGSVIVGLTCSEWEAYLKKYSNVSKEELSDIRDMEASIFDKRSFESRAEKLDAQKATEKSLGKHASLATPLFMLLSVEIKPVGRRKLFSVYGEITSLGFFSGERDYIYKRQAKDAENVGSDGGYLTLNGPCLSCWSDAAYNIFSSKKFSVKLYQRRRLLVDDCIDFKYSHDEFEEINEFTLHTPGLMLIFKYVSIPMATYGRLELNIFNNKNCSSERNSVKVYGEVVAKCKNTFPNYNSEEIVLFKKNPNEYETVAVDYKSTNLLFPTRHWLAVPTYSSLLLHLDLFEYGTNQQILKKDVEMEVRTAWSFSKDFVTTEFVISVFPSWFAPYPPREHKDGGGDGVQISRMLRPCTILRQFSAFEVFSILICHMKCMPLKIHGLLQFSTSFGSHFHDRAVNIFKKDKEYSLCLSGRDNTIPVLEGSRRRNDFDTLSVICDVKDTLGELSIKGFQSCDYDQVLKPDIPLCSIIQGDHGFAALHYAIFTSAVQANLKVFYTEKGLEGVGVPVSGGFRVEYDNFHCKSYYERKHYVITLFESTPEDLVQVGANGLIPLSRSSFVVPSVSSFTLVMNLMIGSHFFNGKQTIKTKGNIKSDTISKSFKYDVGEVKIDLEWSEVQ